MTCDTLRLTIPSEYRDIVNVAKSFSQKFPDLKIPDDKLVAHMHAIQNAAEITAKWQCEQKNTSYTIKSYFPFRFKKLRSLYCLQEGSSSPETDFFDSIARCAPLKTSGGKSRGGFGV